MDRATEVIKIIEPSQTHPVKEEKLNVNEVIQLHSNHYPFSNDERNTNKGVFTRETAFYEGGKRKKFQQCLINLLKNGIESMQPTGELHFSNHSNGMIEIHIEDQGEKGMKKTN